MEEIVEQQTPNQNENNNFFIYILSTILVGAIGFISYIYQTHEVIKKETLHSEYIKESKHNDIVSSFENKINFLENSKIDKKEEKKAQIVQVVQEQNPSLDKTKYNRFSCYDMPKGSYFVTSLCQKQAQIFLEQNKDAKLFEITGIVDNSDFILIDKIEQNKYKTRIKNLYSLAQIGLAQKRAIEGAWVIKNHLGVDVNTVTTNYSITSQKDLRGFIIKTYH